MIENFYEISSKGTLYEPSWHDYVPGKKLEIIPIVGVQWEFKGEKFRKIYSYLNAPELMPNRDGVIAIEKSQCSNEHKDELVLYEPNGRERFRIHPPKVSDRSIPTEAYFYYLGYAKKSGEWICTFNDGAHEYASILDPETGSLSDVTRTQI